MTVLSENYPVHQFARRTQHARLHWLAGPVAHPSGVVAQEIGSALAIPASSLSYLLMPLVERDYLQRRGRRYHAGPGLDRLRRPQEDHPLAERAKPLIRALRLQLDETTSLFEPDGWEMVATITEMSEQSLRYSLDVGSRSPLHCVAAGKAYLAALAPADLELYWSMVRRERFTPQTICNRDALKRDLDLSRRRGFARAEDEYAPGVSAIGVVVRHGDRPIAAVSVAVPSVRFTGESEPAIVRRVVECAQSIEMLVQR